MNPKKNPRRQKPKPEDKFSSPQPKKTTAGPDFLEVNLRDLSPYRPLYGSCHTSHYIQLNNTGMELFETPAQSYNRLSYVELVDQSLKQISGVINFENEHEDSEYSEEGFGDITGSSQEGLSVCEEELLEQEGLNGSEGAKQDIKVAEPIISLEPKQKKDIKRVTQVPESSSQPKRMFCNCKKTKCLKLYCDCFRDNQVCGDGCNCVGCHNLQAYEEERNNAMLSLMDRNPEAFKPKLEEQQHAKGCHCKKSNCQKKYCECFQAGLKCGSNCKCEDCKNGQCQKTQKGHMGHKQELRKGATAKKQRRYRQWQPAV